METSLNPDDLIWHLPEIITHIGHLARSLRRWTGRELLPGVGSDARELSRGVFTAPFALVSHGTQADPVLNYGNLTALRLWETTWDALTRMPSRLTAEAPLREERARLLAAVTEHGFIDDYSGVRISARGRRFRITRATVWNVVDDHGAPLGQAAVFADWTEL